MGKGKGKGKEKGKEKGKGARRESGANGERYFKRDAKPSQGSDGLGLLQNPLRFWFNTGAPGGGARNANRSLGSGHAAERP